MTMESSKEKANEPAAIGDDGLSIRAITAANVGRVPLFCWPESGETRERLLVEQGALGFAAWEEDECVAQLHAYRVTLPEWDSCNFPEWTAGKEIFWSLGWPLLAARRLGLTFKGPVWGHACFHVGVTLRSRSPQDTDARYHHRGIGTALAAASVRWARRNGYAGVMALGSPAGFIEHAHWMGSLPWTTYEKLGFRSVVLEEDGAELPWWAQRDSSDAVVEKACRLRAEGRPVEELCAHLMVLDFQSEGTDHVF